MRPIITFLYSVAGICPHNTHAAFHICSSNPIFVLSLAIYISPYQLHIFLPFLIINLPINSYLPYHIEQMELVNSNTTLSEKISLPSQINHIINQISTLINMQLQASIKFYYFLFFYNYLISN